MLFSDGMTTKVKDHKALFWFTLACTALFGLIAHGYSYFNIMYSHDSLVIYQGEKEMALQLSVGRFMAPVYIWLRGMFYTPSLIAVLSLLFLLQGAQHLLPTSSPISCFTGKFKWFNSLRPP